jgi:hypothetical protein
LASAKPAERGGALLDADEERAAAGGLEAEALAFRPLVLAGQPGDVELARYGQHLGHDLGGSSQEKFSITGASPIAGRSTGSSQTVTLLARVSAFTVAENQRLATCSMRCGLVVGDHRGVHLVDVEVGLEPRHVDDRLLRVSGAAAAARRGDVAVEDEPHRARLLGNRDRLRLDECLGAGVVEADLEAERARRRRVEVLFGSMRMRSARRLSSAALSTT